MNQLQHSFARSAPRAAAEGRGSVVPPLGAPTTIPYQHQTSTGTERGRARRGLCRSTPAVDRRGSHHHATRKVMFPSGICLRNGGASGFRELGRGIALRSFSADGRDCNPGLAKHTGAPSQFQSFSERPQCHSKSPSRYAPTHSEAGGRKIGNFIQGRN
jgi:hypothetical protein